MYIKSRRRSYIWGIIAEYICAAFLIFKCYSILAMRYRNNFGEIDIIAKKAKTIVFIEVKARTNQEAAIISVTRNKQERVLRAANSFIAKNAKYSYHDLRFDLMVVTLPINIYHQKNAWGLT